MSKKGLSRLEKYFDESQSILKGSIEKETLDKKIKETLIKIFDDKVEIFDLINDNLIDDEDLSSNYSWYNALKALCIVRKIFFTFKPYCNGIDCWFEPVTKSMPAFIMNFDEKDFIKSAKINLKVGSGNYNILITLDSYCAYFAPGYSPNIKLTIFTDDEVKSKEIEDKLKKISKDALKENGSNFYFEGYEKSCKVKGLLSELEHMKKYKKENLEATKIIFKTYEELKNFGKIIKKAKTLDEVFFVNESVKNHEREKLSMYNGEKILLTLEICKYYI